MSEVKDAMPERGAPIEPTGAAPVSPTRRIRRALARAAASPTVPMLAALLLVGLFFSLASPFFLTGANLFNIGRQSAVVSVVALGATVVLITGEVDLSMGSVMAVTSVVLGAVLHGRGPEGGALDVVVPVLAALGVGLGFGLFNGAMTALMKAPSFIVTLGTLSIGSGLALSYNRGAPDPILVRSFLTAFGDGKPALGIPALIVYPAFIFALAWLLLNHTLFGIQAYATGGNAEASRLAGVPVRRVKLLALVLSGVLAGFAGVLGTARVRTALPQLGLGIELDAIAAAVLGGTRLSGGYGTAHGTLLGVVLIGTLSNGLTLLGVQSPIQSVIKGSIIIVAVLFDRLRRRR